MREYLFAFVFIIISITSNSQSLLIAEYDLNGNVSSKQTKGSSSIPELSANPENTNPGQASVLTATGCAGTIQWSTGQTGNSITVSPLSSTHYTAECIESGCGANGFERVKVNVIACEVYTLTAITAVASVKLGQPVSLFAYGCPGGIIKWSTGQVGGQISTKVYETTAIYKATCTSEFCDDQGSAYVIVGGTTGCANGDVLLTKQAGSWADPATWACNRVPGINDEVLLNHEVTLYGINGYAKTIIFKNGTLIYSDTGKLYTSANN
ncbi:hypothetical protein [Lacihabitans lacunae]|uniref:Ig-like domain-containing protein n=1 Tax=Lacihabitans lacunae TaxID=1028214 RepID=A0ABV7Z133_9BACT